MIDINAISEGRQRELVVVDSLTGLEHPFLGSVKRLFTKDTRGKAWRYFFLGLFGVIGGSYALALPIAFGQYLSLGFEEAEWQYGTYWLCSPLFSFAMLVLVFLMGSFTEVLDIGSKAIQHRYNRD